MQTFTCAGRHFRSQIFGLLTFWLLAAAPPLRAQYKYRVIDLGSFLPVAVNNLGHVAGNATMPGDSFFHAVVYKNGAVIPLGDLGGVGSSIGGLNNRGEIVGSIRTASAVSRAFIYNGQTTADLWPGLGTNTSAVDINDARHVAGIVDFDRVLYANGAFTTIPGTASSPRAINLRDEITGTANTTPIFSAFLYSGGTTTYPFQAINPTDINDRGEIVGSRNDFPVGGSAFHYANGVLTRLKDLAGTQGSTASAINNAGLIVGTTSDGSVPVNSRRALLWQNGEPIDLNALVDLGASSFAALISAAAISDTNLIAGSGISKAGVQRAFLLEPIATASPQPPWWAARSVVDSVKPAADYAIANQGQAKLLAKKAYDELQDRLPGGAGAALTALISSWTNPAGARDFAALNVGQLKSLAQLFYDRLAQVGYHGPPLSAGQTYPWSTATSDDADFAAANLGQLKHLFSFDLGGTNTDSDNDTLPDWWERWHFGNLTAQDAAGDPDGDGRTNAQEYAAGTDPTVAYS